MKGNWPTLREKRSCMAWVLTRLIAAVFMLAVVWMACRAVDSGGPLAVYAIAVLVVALKGLFGALVRK